MRPTGVNATWTLPALAAPLLLVACSGSPAAVACPALAVRQGISLDVSAYQAAVGHPVAATLCSGSTCSLPGELFLALQGSDGQVVHVVVRVAGGPTSAADITLHEVGTRGCRFGVAGQARLDAAGRARAAP